jgi:hypothetical protein
MYSRRGQSGPRLVVAPSFTELLKRLLESGGQCYWLDPRFVGYGEAKAYTPCD